MDASVMELTEWLRGLRDTEATVTKCDDSVSKPEAAQPRPRCPICGTFIIQFDRGRLPKYCSNACRQKAHRRRNGVGTHQKRKMQDPTAWIGRRLPCSLDARRWWDYDTCDNCGAFYHYDDLRSFISPQSEADWALQEALGVEEAQAFCEACLAEIEADAERIEPGWYERYMSQ